MKTTNLVMGRLFTRPKTKAYDQLKWVKSDSIISNPMTGIAVFEQRNVEFPENWSLNAINIVAQKYFTGTPGTAERESSLKHLIDRVAETITRHGVQENYFDSEVEAEDFMEELKYILATQRAAFNSPVWFNIGAPERSQQASACFILGVEDTMPSILNWYTEEGMIFKGGSGSGINLSAIRSSKESLGKSAGTASGPLSFMRGADSSAGAIKSGGKTRRAAKMVILNNNSDLIIFLLKSFEDIYDTLSPFSIRKLNFPLGNSSDGCEATITIRRRTVTKMKVRSFINFLEKNFILSISESKGLDC